MKMTMFYKERDSQAFTPFAGISNLIIDFCKFGAGGESHLILEMFASDMRKYGNVMHPCPMKVRMDYFSKAVSLELRICLYFPHSGIFVLEGFHFSRIEVFARDAAW